MKARSDAKWTKDDDVWYTRCKLGHNLKARIMLFLLSSILAVHVRSLSLSRITLATIVYVLCLFREILWQQQFTLGEFVFER